MPERVTSRALLLSRVEYGEADLIVRLVTEERGRRSLFVRGGRRSKRRVRGGLDLFTLLHVEYGERSPDRLAVLYDSEVKRVWSGVRGHLLKSASATVALEIYDLGLEDGQGGGELFVRLARYLEWLDRVEEDPARIEIGFHRIALVFLATVGSLPPLLDSPRSGRPVAELERPVLISEVGVIDESERRPGEDGIALRDGSAAHLEAICEGRFPEATGASCAILRKVTYALLQNALPREPRSWSFFVQLAGADG